MRTGLITLLILFLIQYFSFCQSFVYKVVANRGETEYKTIQLLDWMPLKHGIGLKDKDYIKVGENSYLGLIHSSGKLMEVTEPGEMQITELGDRLKNIKKGLPSRYTEYVINTVVSSSSDPIRTRGADKVHPYLPGVAYVYNSQISIHWDPVEDVTDYEVIILDVLGDELWKTSVSETHVSLDLTIPELGKEEDMIFRIQTNFGKSEDYALSRITGDRRQIVQTELEYYTGLLNVQDPLKHLLIGAYFEENGLILDALNAYYKSVDENFENEIFQSFLSRHGLLK